MTTDNAPNTRITGTSPDRAAPDTLQRGDTGTHRQGPPSVTTETERRFRAILREGTPEETVRAYQGDEGYLRAWYSLETTGELDGAELPVPVPVEVVVKFITDHLEGLEPATDEALVEAGVKSELGPHSVSTVERRVYALSKAHELAKVENPCRSPEVRELLKAARRRASRRGERVQKRKALTRDLLDELLTTCQGEGLLESRDRALILFGFATGGRRRSELAAARIEDLEWTTDPETLEPCFLYHLRRSKTDQEGKGFILPVKGRAARALARWLEELAVQIEPDEVAEGPLFRSVSRWGKVGCGLSGRAVHLIIRKRAEQAREVLGAEFPDPELFGAHSLRSGFMTEAGRRKVPLAEAMALSTHKTPAVALGYHQAGDVLHNPAGDLAG